ncbi:MAG: M81 family metallopeptidase [Dehalococcoidia bacterium]|jgi:microcystin degradation protein MlrC|nr:M81 family metallopeptidase [Dehalococcoidia bacterium]
MKIATFGISHETNTFSSIPATYEEFENYGIERRNGIFEKFEDSNYTIAGYIEASKDLNFDLVPLLFAQTGPIGTITSTAYKKLSNEIFSMVEKEGPWDGILISNHGAAVAEGFNDMDGEFCKSIRSIVGDIPIGITLDMHANVSQEIIDQTNICVVWKTNPHLDAKVRGYKCAELVYKTVIGEITPKQSISCPPLLVNIVKQFTGQSPMKELVDQSNNIAKENKVLDTSIAEGYPYSDVEKMGMSWITITDNDKKLADTLSKKMSLFGWSKRKDLNESVWPIEDALNHALKNYKGPKLNDDKNTIAKNGTALDDIEKSNHSKFGPIVLMDVGDNIGGGSSADSTHILDQAMKLKINNILQTLYDPESVNKCLTQNIGDSINLKVGGKSDYLHGNPIEVTAEICNITDGKYSDDGATHAGFKFFNDGTSVVLKTNDGNTILLTSNRGGNTSINQMYYNKIKPESFKIIIAKGVVSPRPAYQPIASEILLVNSPGVTTSDLNFFEYKNIRKNMYPFDKNSIYT